MWQTQAPSSLRRPGPIATDGYGWARCCRELLISCVSRRTEGMGPRFREDDCECVSAPCKKFSEFKFQTATTVRSRAAARAGLLVDLPSNMRGGGAPNGATGNGRGVSP